MNTEQIAEKILDQVNQMFYGTYTLDIHLFSDTYLRLDLEVTPNYSNESYDEDTNSYYGCTGDATFEITFAEIQNAETGENKPYNYTEELQNELKKQSKC